MTSPVLQDLPIRRRIGRITPILPVLFAFMALGNSAFAFELRGPKVGTDILYRTGGPLYCRGKDGNLVPSKVRHRILGVSEDVATASVTDECDGTVFLTHRLVTHRGLLIVEDESVKHSMVIGPDAVRNYSEVFRRQFCYDANAVLDRIASPTGATISVPAEFQIRGSSGAEVCVYRGTAHFNAVRGERISVAAGTFVVVQIRQQFSGASEGAGCMASKQRPVRMTVEWRIWHSPELGIALKFERTEASPFQEPKHQVFEAESIRTP